jgi:hypothetical protein
MGASGFVVKFEAPVSVCVKLPLPDVASFCPFDECCEALLYGWHGCLLCADLPAQHSG